MRLTLSMKLLPTKQQASYLEFATTEYISAINDVVERMILAESRLKLSSKDINAQLPSAVKNQAIRDGNSFYTKYFKTKKISIAKRPVCIWNNQNYRIKIQESKDKARLSFPVRVAKRTFRIETLVLVSDYQVKQLDGELGTLRIVRKGRKWIAQITVNVRINFIPGKNMMGVDLGLKVPAVACIEHGKTKFFGNGRENKYKRRRYKEVRRKLGEKKKIKAIRKSRNKEQRWMSDRDHKVARQIIDFALENNVSTIRLEKLQGIRNTARTSRKNAKNLHMWSFYRLARCIEYKAKLLGIKVEYVNPEYTSRLCPRCKEMNLASDRRYSCKCGFFAHRDRVGAMNIINATVVDGVASA